MLFFTTSSSSPPKPRQRKSQPSLAPQHRLSPLPRACQYPSNPGWGSKQDPYIQQQGVITASQPCLLRPPPPPREHPSPGWQTRSELQKTIVAPVQAINNGLAEWQDRTTGYLNQGAALCDEIYSKFDSVITLIDEECFSGDEKDLVIVHQPQPTLRGGWDSRARNTPSHKANRAITSAITSTNYFSKANFYANSRLPPDLPPLKLYLPTYPLICLAAQYSGKVYARPSGAERQTHIDADWRLGTKAMVIKSVPIDDNKTIVFAIRGSQTFMDWAVNLNSAPTSPTGFLDDPGNLCHSGFLSVARKMIRPVASRLRALLEENPSRSCCSLLITGHSAGGAVASLLYAHMLSTTTNSELNLLTGCFRRVHCINFGSPPVSLLPLSKPPTSLLRKSLFLSFINEGDPVPRADKAYIRSLLDLYASAPPSVPTSPKAASPLFSNSALIPWKKKKKPQPQPQQGKITAGVVQPRPPLSSTAWPVPPATLSNAGRLVVLRPTGWTTGPGTDERVEACVTTDQQLRSVVFGDPLMHMMKLYARRVGALATQAVLGQGWSQSGMFAGR
ncbi:MAG: hypothetical protein M1833_004237 [Piccolia ochrophora]|nr:MAG: hypothetical protein M1833_004237 [Piccolia ochrophora]